MSGKSVARGIRTTSVTDNVLAMTWTQLTPFLVLCVGAIVLSIVMGLNAKTINAKWRAKRDARKDQTPSHAPESPAEYR